MFLLRFFAIPVDGIAFLRHRNAVHRLLAGRQRAPEVAGRIHTGEAVFGAALAAWRAIFMAASPKLQRLLLSAGWRMFCASRRRAATGRLLCPRTGCGTGDAACLDLTCDCETRRPGPRRDGAKLTGAGAPHRWRSGICGPWREVTGGKSEDRVQNRFSSPRINFLCYPSRICIYLCLWILLRYILTLRGKRFARERPHTSNFEVPGAESRI